MRLLENIRDRYDDITRKPYGYREQAFHIDFRNNYEAIAKEWMDYTIDTSSAGSPIDELSAAQSQLNDDKKWKAFFVLVFGHVNPEARTHFPVTTALAEKWKKDVKLAFFSTLEPDKHIPPHTGNNHGVIRAQLGIDITDATNTGLRVMDSDIVLNNGQLFIFDDTFEHEAWNKGKTNRTVLVIDSCKPFPHLFGLLNRFVLHRFRRSDYVMSALAKMKML